MSKFFNETHAHHTQAAAHVPAPRDIQDLVSALKHNLEDAGTRTAQSAVSDLKSLLQPLHESQGVAQQLAERRLEKCLTFRLPRNDEKSFLTTQYNPAMQAAVEAYRTLRTRLVKHQTAMG